MFIQVLAGFCCIGRETVHACVNGLKYYLNVELQQLQFDMLLYATIFALLVSIHD